MSSGFDDQEAISPEFRMDLNRPDYVSSMANIDAIGSGNLGGLPASGSQGFSPVSGEAIPEDYSPPYGPSAPLALPTANIPFTPDRKPVLGPSVNGYRTVNLPEIEFGDLTPAARKMFDNNPLLAEQALFRAPESLRADYERAILGKMNTAGQLYLPLPEGEEGIEYRAKRAGMSTAEAEYWQQSDPKYIQDQINYREVLARSGDDGYTTGQMQTPEGARRLRWDAVVMADIEKNLAESGITSMASYETKRILGEFPTMFGGMWRTIRDVTNSAQLGLMEWQRDQLKDGGVVFTGGPMSAEDRQRRIRDLDQSIGIFERDRQSVIDWERDLRAEYEREPIRTGNIAYDYVLQPALGVSTSLVTALAMGPVGSSFIAASYGSNLYNRAVDEGVGRPAAFIASLAAAAGAKYFGDIQLANVRGMFSPRSPGGNWLRDLGHGVLVGGASNAGQSISSTIPYAFAKTMQEGSGLSGFGSNVWADRENWYGEAYGGAMFAFLSGMLGLPIAARNHGRSMLFTSKFKEMSAKAAETRLFSEQPRVLAEEINNSARHHGGAGITFASIADLEQGGLTRDQIVANPVLGITPTQFDQAKATNMDLAIPVGNATVFAAQQAKAGNAYYQEAFKADPAAMTMPQIVAQEKEVQAALKLAETHYNAMATPEGEAKIPDRIKIFRAGLRAAGRSTEEANAASAMFLARAERAAEQWGETTEQWLERKDVQLEFDNALAAAREINYYRRLIEDARSRRDVLSGRAVDVFAEEKAAAEPAPMETAAAPEAAQPELTQPAITEADNQAWVDEASTNIMEGLGLEGEQYAPLAEAVRSEIQKGINDPNVRQIAEQLGMQLPPAPAAPDVATSEPAPPRPIVEELYQGDRGARTKFDAAPTPSVNSDAIRAIPKEGGIVKGIIKLAEERGVLGEHTNDDTGWTDINVTKTSIRDIALHKAGDGKLALIQIIPELIRNGIYLETTPRNDRGSLSHIFAAKATVDGTPYVVGFTINEDRNGKRYYNHEMTEMKKALGGTWPEANNRPGTSTGREPISSILHRHLNVKPDALLQAGSTPEAARGGVVFPKYADAPTIVRLLKNSDVSTVIHELNHLFVKDLADMVTAGRGGEQARADWASLVAFTGGDLDSTDPTRWTRGMERIASSWERYAMEGVAPSPELLHPFDTFRSYLSRIYRGAREQELAVPSPEVRTVFDRFLATDRQIAEARNQTEILGNIEDYLKNISDARRQRIKKSRSDADSAIRRRRDPREGGRALRGLGDLAETRRLIRGETENVPVYRALDTVKREGGLDRASVEREIGTVAAQVLADKHGEAVFGGTVDYEALAGANGYPDGQAMLADMMQVRTVEESVDARVEQELRTRDAADAASAEEDGDTAYDDGGDEGAAVIQEKLEGIFEDQAAADKRANPARKLREWQARVAAEKKAVERFIGNMSMREAVDVRRFETAERDASKAALRAAQKGDLAEAERWTKIEYLHHLEVREAMRARELRRWITENANTRSLLKALQADQFHPKMENSFAESFKDLITFIGFTDNRKLKPAVQSDTLILPTAEAGSNVAEFLPDLSGTLEPWMLMKTRPEGYQGWRDFTYDQIKETVRVMKLLTDQGRGVLHALQEEGVRNNEELVAKSIDPMGVRPDREGQKDDRSRWGRIQNGINKFLVSATVPEYWFMMMDGNPTIQGKEEGINQRLFRKMRDCESAKDVLYRGLVEQMQPHFDSLDNARREIEKSLGGKQFAIPGLPVPEMLSKRRGQYTWDADQILSIALNMGNDANLYSLTDGYGFSREQLDLVGNLLSADAWKAIQGVWDGINSLYPQLDAVTFKLTNRHMVKEQAQSLTVRTSDGQMMQLAGGYFPLVYDPMLSERAGQIKNVEDATYAGVMYNIHQSTKPADGWRNERMRDENGKPLVARPQLLRTNLITQHLEAATHYITHAETIREFDRMTRDPLWKSTYENKFGVERYRAIRNWMQDLARPNRMDNSMAAQLMEHFRTLATINALGLRFGTSMKQRQALFPGAAFMTDASRTGISGWKYVKKGVREIGFGGNFGLKSDKMKWVDSVSDYMKTRDGSANNELRHQLEKISPLHQNYHIPVLDVDISKKSIHDAQFFMIQANDRACAYGVWVGAYEQARAGDANFSLDGLTDEQVHDKAVRYADSAASTQSSSFAADLTAMQRSKGIEHFLGMFMSGNVRQGSRLLQYIDAHQMDYKSKADIVNLILRESVYPSLAYIFARAAALYGMSLALGLPPDDESLITQSVWDSIETTAAPFPLLREIPSVLHYGPSNLPAMEMPGKAVFNLGQAAWKDIPEGEYAKALYRIVDSAGFWLGVPATNVLRQLQPVGEAAGIVERKKR